MERITPNDAPDGRPARADERSDGRPDWVNDRLDRTDGNFLEATGGADERLGAHSRGAADEADEPQAGAVRIGIAGPGHAELIADLARRTFYDAFAAQNTAENMRIFQEEQFTRQMQIAEVGAPGRTFFLAWVNGKPVGFASMRESPPPRALGAVSAIEIVQLYSEQKTIGKGVGKALMAACLEFARQKGKDWVWLGVWEHNPRAIAFYSKWGFERFGEHIFLVGLDAQTDWWMKKKL